MKRGRRAVRLDRRDIETPTVGSQGPLNKVPLCLRDTRTGNMRKMRETMMMMRRCCSHHALETRMLTSAAASLLSRLIHYRLSPSPPTHKHNHRARLPQRPTPIAFLPRLLEPLSSSQTPTQPPRPQPQPRPPQPQPQRPLAHTSSSRHNISHPRNPPTPYQKPSPPRAKGRNMSQMA